MGLLRYTLISLVRILAPPLTDKHGVREMTAKRADFEVAKRKEKFYQICSILLYQCRCCRTKKGSLIFVVFAMNN